MFHWRVLVMQMILLSYSVSGSILALKYVFIVVHPIHLRGYQQPVSLTLFIRITLFVCTNILNLPFVTTNLYMLVALGFLIIPKFLALIKQETIGTVYHRLTNCEVTNCVFNKGRYVSFLQWSEAVACYISLDREIFVTLF